MAEGRDMAYRSGFHGFCAATADFLNSQVGVGEGEEPPYQPIDVAVEAFNDTDRFSRGGYAKHRAFIVTQSRANGTPRLFETAWLGDEAPHDERAALTAFARFVASGEGSSLIRLMLDGLGDPAADFWNLIMAALTDGLRTQRYSESDISRFSRRVGDLLGTMDFSDDKDVFALMFRIAAALFYGPACPYALMGQVDVTQGSQPAPRPLRHGTAHPRLLVAQVLDEQGAWVGVHGVASEATVLFLGREDDASAYEARCDEDLAGLIAGRRREILALPLSNKWVSRVHGVVYFEGESWRFEDLGSTYRSQVRRPDGEPAGGDGASELRPGDRICLGVDGVEDRFGGGATLAVAFLADAFSPAAEDVVADR